jgi:hypothetical protein
MIKILYPKPGEVSRMGGKQLMEIQADTEAEIMALRARVDDGVQTFVAAPGSVAHTPDHSADWEFSPAGTWVKRGGGTPYERVILPETVMHKGEDDGNTIFLLPTKPSATFEHGKTYGIGYNGTVYECVAINLGTALDGVADGEFVFGNVGASGMPEVPGFNPDAPFFMFAVPEGQLDGEVGTTYAMLMPLDGAESVTLSIREKVKVESAGGGTWVLECVGFKITDSTEAGLIIGSGQASHTFEETVKSINNGRIPVLKAQMEGQGTLFLPLVTVTDEAIIFGLSVHGTQSTGYVQPDGLLQITLNEPM